MDIDEEIKNIKNGIYNLEFLDNQGNNDLILSVRINNIDHLKNIFKLDPLSINFKNLSGDNVLIESLRYNNFDASRYLILNTDINLDHKGTNDLTAFSWACHRNNMEILILLMDKSNDLFDIDDINTLCKDEDIKNIISKKYLDYKEKVFSKSFRKYDENDFKIIKKINNGVYGDVFLAIDSNGNEYAIKDNKSCKKNKRIENDIIKELIFMKILNDEKVTPYLYGYYFKDSCIFLVMEKMKCTLEYYGNIINFLSEDETEKHRTKIIKKTLKCLKVIHSYGIQHSDITANNIMLSFDNKIKIIDFGISNFLGVKPNNITLKNFKSSIQPPDSYESRNVTLKILDKYQSFDINRSSYSSDIYSLGKTFLNTFSKDVGTYNPFIILDGIVYEKYDRIYKIVKYSIPKNILSLIESMTKMNSIERPTEDLLLRDFDNKETTFLQEILNQSYTDNSILEIKYLDDMINIYKNLTFPFNQASNKIYELLNSLFSKYDKYVMSYDSLISTIISFHGDNLKLGFNYLNIFSSIFEYESQNITLENISQINFQDIHIYPVSIMIEHVSLKNYSLKYSIYKNFLKYCLLRNSDVLENIYEIVQLIYLILSKEHKDINVNHDYFQIVENIINTDLDVEKYENLKNMF